MSRNPADGDDGTVRVGSPYGAEGGPVSVLYVDDDPAVVELAVDVLEDERERFDVAAATDPRDALDELAGGGVDCVVSDYAMPGMDGLELLAAVREDHPELPFVLHTARGSEAVAAEAVSLGATGYLVKASGTETYERLADRIDEAVGAARGAAHRAAERGVSLELLRDLYDVTTDADLSFEDKTALLLELGCERLGLPYGFLSRIEADDDGAGTQRIVQAHGEHDLLQSGELCPLEQAYCRKTIETDGLLAVADAVEAGWEDDPAYELFDLGSYVGGKVVVDGDLYGTLCFAASEPRGAPFTADDRTVVRVMSKWVGYELERRGATERLQRQNERLQEFASILAHDLRNPLSVAMGNLELARTEPGDEHLDQIEGALDRMDDLIDDVLALAREGEAVTDTEGVDLAATVESCWRNVDTGGATLVADTDRVVRADRSRFQQLLENLVRNAVEHGGADVTVTVGDLRDGFYLEDDGPGIPEDDREEVFASGFTTSADGTGFGLAIVEQIAEAHDWSIRATSGTDGGARFEVTGVEFVEG